MQIFIVVIQNINPEIYGFTFKILGDYQRKQYDKFLYFYSIYRVTC